MTDDTAQRIATAAHAASGVPRAARPLTPADGAETEPPPSEALSSGPITSIPPTELEGPRTDAPPPISFTAPSGPRRATLTLMTGANAGEVFTLSGESCVLGRAPDCGLFVNDPGVSRRHARIFRRLDGKYFVEDLDSSNGTYVGPRSVTRCELSPGDRVRIGPSAMFRFALADEAEEALQRKLYDASTRDALTRVYNRRYFEDRFAMELGQARRKGTPLALLLIDLDYFKQTNDTHGHLAGDQVLRTVAGHVALYLRADDFVARFGGEEFAIVARAPRTSAAILAERMRVAIEKLPVSMEAGPLYVTASFGVAELSEIAPDAAGDTLIALADQRLYRAKAQGRNCVCASSE